MQDNKLDFEVPTNFVDYPKYRVGSSEMPPDEDIPEIVKMNVFGHLPATFPSDVLNVFYYFRRGFLPVFVVNWFMKVFPDRMSKMTRFYKALHAIERMRSDHYSLEYEGYTSDEEETEGEDEDETEGEDEGTEGED